MVKPGMRVTVPFGARKIMGYVVGITAESQFNKLKEIHDVLDVTPVLTRELLELGKWLADKTLCMYIIAYQAMVPQVFKAQYKKEIVRLTEAERSEEHTSELQSRFDLVCRLLLEKKKKKYLK